VLTIIPVGFAVYAGFTSWNGIGPLTWTGLSNYTQLIVHDGIFHTSLLRTFYYAIATVVLESVVAFCLALLLNERLRGYSVYRALLFVPYVIAGVPLFIVWTILYAPHFGLINYLLGLVGIAGPNWLNSTTWAMPALIIMAISSCGGMMLVFVAGLQTVPEELYEAAKVHGAGAVRRVRSVTIPFIRPILGFNIIWAIIIALQVFAQPYSMTSGGPDYATEVVGLDTYQNAFQYYHFGYASAIAVITFIRLPKRSLPTARPPANGLPMSAWPPGARERRTPGSARCTSTTAVIS
jgi:multiple sugar transport system permease protein